MPIVIVITGPCGAGKTTISTLLAEKFSIPYLKGDDVKEELFPGLMRISEHPKELKVVKAELLKRTLGLFQSGQSVIVEYVVLGEYIKEFQEAFGDQLIMKVLYPSVDVLIQRDATREDWTAGEDHVRTLYEKFKRDEELIGKENFIDNSHESAEETFETYFKSLLQ